MAKVKTNFKPAKKQMRQYKEQGQKALEDKLGDEIKESILRGVSPVKGKGRLPGYSDSYLASIKNGTYKKYNKGKRPVNMKLSGEMLDSLFVKKSKKGLKVGFDNKLADIHNREGAGKSKTIRRLLPTKQGEVFSRSITMRLRDTLKAIAKRVFK